MAPKAAAAKKGKDAPKDEPSAATAAPTSSSAPKNKEEVLAQINLDGLPHCPNEQILEIVREKYETLVAVFIHYCKQSECKTLDEATRLKLGAPDVCAQPPSPLSDAPPRAAASAHECIRFPMPQLASRSL